MGCVSHRVRHSRGFHGDDAPGWISTDSNGGLEWLLHFYQYTWSRDSRRETSQKRDESQGLPHPEHCHGNRAYWISHGHASTLCREKQTIAFKLRREGHVVEKSFSSWDVTFLAWSHEGVDAKAEKELGA